MPAGRSLRPSPRRVQRALCELAPVPAARQKLVCFPPSLDLMARKDRLPHRVPGRPTAREAACASQLHNWALLSPFGQLAARDSSPGQHLANERTLGAPAGGRRLKLRAARIPRPSPGCAK